MAVISYWYMYTSGYFVPCPLNHVCCTYFRHNKFCMRSPGAKPCTEDMKNIIACTVEEYPVFCLHNKLHIRLLAFGTIFNNAIRLLVHVVDGLLYIQGCDVLHLFHILKRKKYIYNVVCVCACVKMYRYWHRLSNSNSQMALMRSLAACKLPKHLGVSQGRLARNAYPGVHGVWMLKAPST